MEDTNLSIQEVQFSKDPPRQIQESKRVKLFALLINSVPLNLRSISIVVILNTLFEISIVLDHEILKIWREIAGSTQIRAINGSRMLAFDTIEFLSKLTPSYFIHSMDFSALILMHLSILAFLSLICVTLIKPELILGKKYFENTRSRSSSTLLTSIALIVANYHFVFIFCCWLLFVSIPCTDLSAEQNKQFEKKASSFFNTIDSEAIKEVTPTKSSCISEEVYCYDTGHILILIANIFILPANLFIRLYMDKLVKFTSDPLFVGCRRSFSDYFETFMIFVVMITKMIIYLAHLSDNAKLSFFVFTSGIALMGGIAYQSKNPIYFDRSLSRKSTMRHIFLFCLLFMLSQMNATRISFTTDNYCVMISSLLLFSIILRLVLDSSEKERFKLNLNSNEDILQSLYYVLKYSKQHGSPPSHNDDMTENKREHWHHSKLLQDLHSSLSSKVKLIRDKKKTSNESAQEPQETKKVISSSHRGMLSGRKYNYTIDNRMERIENLKESFSGEDQNIYPFIRNKGPNTKISLEQYLSSQGNIFIGKTPPQHNERREDDELKNKESIMSPQVPQNSLLKTDNTISEDLKLVDSIIKLKILELISKDMNSVESSLLSFITLYARLNMLYMKRHSKIIHIVSVIKNKLKKNSSASNSLQGSIRFKLSILIETIRLKSAELMRLNDVSRTNNFDQSLVGDRNRQSSPLQIFDFTSVYKYLNLFENLKTNILKILGVKTASLEYLHESNFEFSGFFSFSKKFFILKTRINKQLEEINVITGGKFANVNILQSYYYRYIMQDLRKGMSINQSLNRKAQYDINMIMNQDEYKSCIVTVVQASLEAKDCHSIVLATDNITKSLGYLSSDILGLSINLLLPTSYREAHSIVAHPLMMTHNIINRHDNKNDKRFAMHASRRVVACSIGLKVNPLNDSGIQVAANLVFSRKQTETSFIILGHEEWIESTDKSLVGKIEPKKHLSTYSYQLASIIKDIIPIQDSIFYSSNAYDTISSSPALLSSYKSYILLTLGLKFELTLEDGTTSVFSVRLASDSIQLCKKTINVLSLTPTYDNTSVLQAGSSPLADTKRLHELHQYLSLRSSSNSAPILYAENGFEYLVSPEENRLIDLVYWLERNYKFEVQGSLGAGTHRENMNYLTLPNEASPTAGLLSRERPYGLNSGGDGDRPSESEPSNEKIGDKELLNKTVMNNTIKENSLESNNLESLFFTSKRGKLAITRPFSLLLIFFSVCLIIMTMITVTIHKHIIGLEVLLELNERLILVEASGILSYEVGLVLQHEAYYHALYLGYVGQDYMEEVFLGGNLQNLLDYTKFFVVVNQPFPLQLKVRNNLQNLKFDYLAQSNLYKSPYFVNLRLPKLFDEIMTDFDLEEKETKMEITALFQYVHPITMRWAIVYGLGDPMINLRGVDARKTIMEFMRRVHSKDLMAFVIRQLEETNYYILNVGSEYKKSNDINAIICFGLIFLTVIVIFGFILVWKNQMDRFYAELMYLRRESILHELYILKLISNRVRMVIRNPFFYHKERKFSISAERLVSDKFINKHATEDELSPEIRRVENKLSIYDTNKIKEVQPSHKRDIDIRLITRKEKVIGGSKENYITDAFEVNPLKSPLQKKDRMKEKNKNSSSSNSKERIQVSRTSRVHFYGMIRPLLLLIVLILPVMIACIVDCVSVRSEALVVKNLVKIYSIFTLITAKLDFAKTAIIMAGAYGTKYDMANENIIKFTERMINEIEAYINELISLQKVDLGSFQGSYKNLISETNMCDDLTKRPVFNIDNCGSSYTSPYNTTMDNSYKIFISAMKGALSSMKSIASNEATEEKYKNYWNTGTTKGLLQVSSRSTLNVNALLMMGDKIQASLQFYFKTIEISESTATTPLIRTLSLFSTAKIFTIVSVVYFLFSLPFLYHSIFMRLSFSFKYFNAGVEILPVNLMISNPLLRKYWRK